MSWAHQVHAVVHHLADVIRPSFGPLGLDQLLHSPATLLVTNSSSTILASLIASPHFLPASTTSASQRAITSVVLNQLRQCVELHGDGSGAVLLMVEAAMQEVVGWMRERGVGEVEDSSVRGRAQYVTVSRLLVRSLDGVDREWLQAGDEAGEVKESRLMTELRGVGESIDSTFPALLTAFRQLLHTQLGQTQHLARPCLFHSLRRLSPHTHSHAVAVLCAAGKFSGNVANVLQRVVVDFISSCYEPGCSISEVCESVRSTQPLAMATPASVSQSIVLRGLLLDRGLATREMPSRVIESALLSLLSVPLIMSTYHRSQCHR